MPGVRITAGNNDARLSKGPAAVEILAQVTPAYSAILSPQALEFLASLARSFTPRVEELLQRRLDRQARFDEGERPHFLEETLRTIRESNWTVAPLPADLQDRRIEITGPSSNRKMVINALNSGANVYMTDFEDSNCPTWDNMIQGQIMLLNGHSPTKTLSQRSTIR